MLTPEQIAALRDQAGQITDPITNFLLEDIARRVSEAGQLTSTAAYQVWRAQQLGVSQRELKKKLKRLLKVSNRELRQLLTQSAEVGYDFDIKRLPQVQAVPFHRNESLQQIVAAAVELAQEDFTNLTQTLGMVDPFGNALPLQDVYRSCTDFAFKQVITGAADYNTAIRRATKNLAEKGVLTIDYASGVHTSLEAAVRRNIMGGLGLMQEQITQHNHDELGCDGWEISAHANSAPDHEPIQGKQYSDAAYEALNNSLVRRIGTLNCGHAAFPIILGVNEPQYSPEELEKFREDNAAGITYEGKHYTGYEATQMQRKLERSMRLQKRRILTAEATGDKDALAVAQTRLQRLRQEYSRFSKAAGLRTQEERIQVAGFGRKEAARASAAAKAQKATVPNSAKNVEIRPQHDRIKAEEKIGVVEVREVGRIDIEKYRCVTSEISTDEVIITDERIDHIKERHPNDYERFVGYFPEIISDPDYIIASDRPNTAVILKEIEISGEKFKLILRLKVKSDPAGYKNSVISFWHIGDTTWRKTIKNKNILYKKE